MWKILVGMHQGEPKMRQRARLSVYWPNMDVDISNAAKSCDSCISRLPSSPAEPLRPHEPATRPFQFVHADIGEDDGRQFLVIVDRFSGWPDVTIYDDKNTTANLLVNSCRTLFATMGAPKGLWSDNQPFKAAFFQDFLAKFKVSWHSSSPHHPQSNGRAKAEIKQVKKLVCGSIVDGRVDLDKLAQALMLFRNTPRCGGGLQQQHTRRERIQPTTSRRSPSTSPLLHQRMAAGTRRARTPSDCRAREEQRIPQHHRPHTRCSQSG